MLSLKHFKSKKLSGNKGFTLIEIAIVLVIIGLILGAAVKGKDLIQSAKQKKYYTDTVKTWELVVLNYYDRTGAVLADGTANGGTAGTTNGLMERVDASNFGNANGINARLSAIGLSVPNSPQITFKGEFTIRTINMRLQNIGGNCLYFPAIPTDLAIAIDRMVDGTIDGSTGTFRRWANAAWPDASTTVVVNAQYRLDVP